MWYERMLAELKKEVWDGEDVPYSCPFSKCKVDNPKEFCDRLELKCPIFKINEFETIKEIKND
ncbi:hypothetical protein LCGC14_1211550 [marine sediment metagenome]|uniref:Uncharacterized protein n=1 Tax=marine sediment metagenome TaxID=412755 RepID=A0A0F9LI98_9ZZZZ